MTLANRGRLSEHWLYQRLSQMAGVGQESVRLTLLNDPENCTHGLVN
jgi:hypothetical protein